MNDFRPEAMAGIAAECVTRVGEEFGRHLDWSVNSLVELDEVCAALLADGPLTGPRLEQWTRLAGAYTGEVVVRTYGGEWISSDRAPGAPAVLALGVTGFPLATAHRILTGEPYKRLASFARAVPAISEHSRRSP